MADMFLLSDADRLKLQKLMSEHNISRVTHQPPDPLSQAPEVYIAKVQDDPGSIPALEAAGEGESYDHPGVANCDIYQVYPGTSSGEWDLVPISNFSQPVYNIYSSTFDDEWIIVVKAKSGHWLVTSGSPSIRRFELKDALTPGGNATAYACDDAWAEDTSVEFEVYDSLGTRRGRAKDALSSPNDKGSQGYARFMPDSGHWEIVDMQPHALHITALVNEASGVATTDSTFAIDNIAIKSPTGALFMEDLTSGDKAYNVFGWKLDNNGRVDLDWNEATDHWETIQGKCPA